MGNKNSRKRQTDSCPSNTTGDQLQPSLISRRPCSLSLCTNYEDQKIGNGLCTSCNQQYRAKANYSSTPNETNPNQLQTFTITENDYNVPPPSTQNEYLCSQPDFINYEDKSNVMSFCTQCYENYEKVLGCPSDTSSYHRYDKDRTEAVSSTNMAIQESQRLSRDSYSTGLYRPATTADHLSSYSSSQRPAYDGISASNHRPTCTSYTSTTFTISARPTGTHSSRPTGTPSTRTTVIPSARPTVNPHTRPFDTPPTRPTGTHLTKHTGIPSTRTTVIHSGRPIGTHSTTPTCTPSTRTAANSAYTKAADSSSSLYTSDTLFNYNVKQPTPSASSAGGGHGYSSSGSVTSSDSQHNVMRQLNASMGNQDNGGARPKQYKATNQAKPKPLMDVVVKPKESTASNTSNDTILALPGSKPSEISTKHSSKKDDYNVPPPSTQNECLCSQPGCINYEDKSNVMSFCTQCYENYEKVLGCPSDTSSYHRYDKDRTEAVSSTNMAIQAPLPPTPFSQMSLIRERNQPNSSKLTSYHDSDDDFEIVTSKVLIPEERGTSIKSGAITLHEREAVSPQKKVTCELERGRNRTFRVSNTLGDLKVTSKPNLTMVSSTSPKNQSFTTSTNQPNASRGTDSTEASLFGHNKGSSTGNKLYQNDSQGVINAIRDSLICPICLDLLENAKTLPCQHVVCKECLEQWMASKGELRCPTCNTRQSEPESGVNGLPSNFMLNNLAAEMKKLDPGEETDLTVVEEEEKVHEEPRSTSVGATLTNEHSTHSYPDDDEWQRTPVANMSFLERLGTRFGYRKGCAIQLRVQLCNAEGHPIRGRSSDIVHFTVCEPMNEEVDVSNVSLNKGTGDIIISFIPQRIGVHMVNAYLAGEAIVGSPMKIVVYSTGQIYLVLKPVGLSRPKGIALLGTEIFITDNFVIKTNWSCEQYKFSGTNSHVGSDLVNPFGITEYAGRLFITDLHSKCVYMHDNNGYLYTFGKGCIKSPTGIAVSKNGMIYVADSSSNTIKAFSSTFTLSRSTDLKCQMGLECFPALLALNKTDDKIIVADNGANLIRIVDLDTGRIKIVKTRVQHAPATPFGVAVDQDDNIFVSLTFDPSRLSQHQVFRNNQTRRTGGAINIYAPSGYYLGTIGDQDLVRPRGICIVNDPSPQLLVVEAGNSQRNPCINIYRI
ncbi:uncharacterized protein [Apostichopus japonicus]|uniref:uncharacterized protein isoform X3 n=1 Tax=Stichopus japonicus TaxID=307972 RepID=UPI003AB8FECC